MHDYVIQCFRVGREGREPSLRMEFPREHFTSREFKGFLISTLLELAAEGKYYKHLDAVVTRDGEKFLTVRCDSDLVCKKIVATLVLARPREVFRPLRAATIAEGKDAKRWLRR